MSPTDLPPNASSGDAGFPADGQKEVPRPPRCAILEEDAGDEARFTIPPQAEVVPRGQMIFAFLWVSVWTLAMALYVVVPNAHGPVFNFLALVAGLAGEYLALLVLFSALRVRLAVERISVGPAGVRRETRLGPWKRTRRVSLSRVHAFRVQAFPLSRGSGKWSAHLYMLLDGPGGAGGKDHAGSLRLAEGARDEDKYWLASRLNSGLRASREAHAEKI